MKLKVSGISHQHSNICRNSSLYFSETLSCHCEQIPGLWEWWKIDFVCHPRASGDPEVSEIAGFPLLRE